MNITRKSEQSLCDRPRMYPGYTIYPSLLNVQKTIAYHKRWTSFIHLIQCCCPTETTSKWNLSWRLFFPARFFCQTYCNTDTYNFIYIDFIYNVLLLYILHLLFQFGPLVYVSRSIRSRLSIKNDKTLFWQWQRFGSCVIPFQA